MQHTPYNRRVLLATFALLCIFNSQAADINLVRGAKGEEDIISIKGDFKIGDENKFRELALNSNRATVFLDSDGGKLQPALEIGKIIRIKGFATAVQDTICSSACAMVWLAGEPRMMSNFTSIGFHAPFTLDPAGKAVSDAIHGALTGSYLTGLGFSPRVVMFVVSAGANDLHLLNKATADRLGIAVTFNTAAQRRRATEAYSEGLKATNGPSPAMEAAAQLYRQSAVLGFAGAQNNLGDLYETGQGVPKSNKLAVYWYTRAAERGEPTAYFSLASILAEGAVDTEVQMEALKYAALAYNSLPDGHNKAGAEALAKTIKAKLSAAEIERVLELAARWVPLYQEDRLLGDAVR